MSKKYGKGYEWMEIEMDNDPDCMIVDIGYVNEEEARNRADQLFAAGVSSRNLIWGPSTGQLRIHVRIPRTKQKMILSKFPIDKKKTWFGSNYSWLNN